MTREHTRPGAKRLTLFVLDTTVLYLLDNEYHWKREKFLKEADHSELTLSCAKHKVLVSNKDIQGVERVDIIYHGSNTGRFIGPGGFNLREMSAQYFNNAKVCVFPLTEFKPEIPMIAVDTEDDPTLSYERSAGYTKYGFTIEHLKFIPIELLYCVDKTFYVVKELIENAEIHLSNVCDKYKGELITLAKTVLSKITNNDKSVIGEILTLSTMLDESNVLDYRLSDLKVGISFKQCLLLNNWEKVCFTEHPVYTLKERKETL